MKLDFLWAIWLAVTLGGFAFLEWAALTDRLNLQPLTFWIRHVLVHYTWLFAIVVGGFLSWLAAHLILEPILKNKRIRREMRRKQ